MLYIEVNTARELRQKFIDCDRDYYTLKACELMLEYFENEIVELDVIALCGFFSENTLDEIIDIYKIEIEDEENKLKEVLECLNNNTWASETLNNTILYTSF
jgi:hypothetical protein